MIKEFINNIKLHLFCDIKRQLHIIKFADVIIGDIYKIKHDSIDSVNMLIKEAFCQDKWSYWYNTISLEILFNMNIIIVKLGFILDRFSDWESQAPGGQFFLVNNNVA